MPHLYNLLGQSATSPQPAADWAGLERFLVLGSEAGRYDVAGRSPALEDVPSLRAALCGDGPRAVNTIVEIASSGRAPRRDPAVFALAAAASPHLARPETNALALAALPLVARTATHLAAFVAYARALRGWGRALRNAVALWYLEKPARELAVQMLKQHPRRAGWSHRDLIRMAHPRTNSGAHQALFRWALEGELDPRTPPELLEGELRPLAGVERLKEARDEREAAQIVEQYALAPEMLPSQWKNSVAVWDALVPSLPYQALVRALGRLTALGLIATSSETGALVVARLLDRSRIRRARVHPVALAAALAAYRAGQNASGKLRWTPVVSVEAALETAFYAAFDNLDAAPSRLCVAVDSLLGDTDAATAAAYVLTLKRSHAEVHMNVSLTGRERLQAAVAVLEGERGALPDSVGDATARLLEVDAFVFLAGSGARVRLDRSGLERYRRAAGIAAKWIAISFRAAEAVAPDADDPLQLSIAGFDSSVPAVVEDFIARG